MIKIIFKIIFQHLRELQLKIAFHFLQKAEFQKAIDLLVKSEANPHPMLTLIAKQHPQLRLEEALDGRKFTELPVEGKFPEIPLPIGEQYLERVYAGQWADGYAEVFFYILLKNLNNNFQNLFYSKTSIFIFFL